MKNYYLMIFNMMVTLMIQRQYLLGVKKMEQLQNMRVNLTKIPESNQLNFPNTQSRVAFWYNLDRDFEAIADSVEIFDLLKYDLSEEKYDTDQQYDDQQYDANVQIMYKILKKVTSKGISKTNIKNFGKIKNGILAYAKM